MMNIEKHVKESFKELIKETLKQVIEHCRIQQKEYEVGNSEVSGVTILQDLFDKDIIPTGQYDNIKRAVENYNDPYEINLED